MKALVDLRRGRDIRQSREYGKFMERIGWEVKELEDKDGKVRMFVRRMGWLRIVKVRRPGNEIPWDVVRKEIKKIKAIYSQVDPEEKVENWEKLGFRKNRNQLLGTKTLLVDLRPTEEEILKSFKPETRRKLKKLEEEKVKTDTGDWEKFYTILRKGYREIDVWCPPEEEYKKLVESFGNKASCVCIGEESGCMVLENEGVGEYYYAAATQKGKLENWPYLTVWKAMQAAKKRGVKVWDFNGLIDERWPDKRWAGFSFFKRRFGGEELEFAGTYSKWGW